MKSPLLLLLLLLVTSVAGAVELRPAALRPGDMPLKLGGRFDDATIQQAHKQYGFYYASSPAATFSLPAGAPNGIRLRGQLNELKIKTPSGEFTINRTSGDNEYVLPAIAPGDVAIFPRFSPRGWGPVTVEVIGQHPWPDALPTVEVAGDQVPAPVVTGGDAVGKGWTPVTVVHFTKPTGRLFTTVFGDQPDIRWRKYRKDGTTYMQTSLGGTAADDSYVLEVKGTGHVTVVLWQGDGKTKIDPLASIQPIPDNLPVEKRHAETYFLVGMNHPEMTFAERQQLFVEAGPKLWVYPTVDLDKDGPKQGEPVLVVGRSVYTADGLVFDAPDDKLLAATGGAIPAKARPFDLGPKLALHASKDPQRDLDDPRVAPIAKKYKSMSDRYYACVTKILDRYGDDAADFDVVTYDSSGHIKSVENLRSKGWREAERSCGSRDGLARKLLVVAKQASDAFQVSRQERMDKMR